jgi:hypothetical protein
MNKGGIMQAAKLKPALGASRNGYVLILMVLIVFLVGAIIWLDPMKLIRSSTTGMPWDEEKRIVRPEAEVKQPNEGQPKILESLVFKGPIVEDNEVKGGVELYISTDGRITGVWGGTYKPEPDITWEVAGSRFKGNIDPSKIYSDANGEDRKRLYFITKGKSLILETNSKTDRVRTATGAIYVTGWLDNDYNAVGKITITSDKKTYWEYPWEARAEKALMIPDFGKPLPGLF